MNDLTTHIVFSFQGSERHRLTWTELTDPDSSAPIPCSLFECELLLSLADPVVGSRRVKISPGIVIPPALKTDDGQLRLAGLPEWG